MAAPTISVVIPTRDRPDSLARLLRCIQQQSFDDFECLVIDDGSGEETLARYDAIWRSLDDRFQLHRKPRHERGGGPGRSRNKGIALARGTYVGFCDDDDLWLRDDHLATAAAALTKYGADFFLANIRTSSQGIVQNPDWYAVPGAPLLRHPLPGEPDLFAVTRKDQGRLFVHRNLHADTLVIEKRLLTEVGMYWEGLTFAEDHEIGLRLADKAKKIIFRSTVVGDLDVSPHPSIARSYEMRERVLFGILACLLAECLLAECLLAECLLADPGLRRVARANRAWRSLELADLAWQAERRRETLELAAQALFLHPSVTALRMIGKALIGR